MGIRQRKQRTRASRTQARRRLLLEQLETRRLLAVDLAAIEGIAFVDLTGDGLTGDDTRLSGATVELYRDDGDGVFDSAADTLIDTTTTDGTGAYRFASTNAGGSLPADTLAVDDYFIRQLPTGTYSPPNAQLATVTSGDVDGATVQTIDSFDTTEQVVTADPVTTTASSSLAATEVLGGERDVLVNYTSGSGEVAVQIDYFDSNLFAFVSGLNVIGDATIQYDGADGDAVTLDTSGLAGADLSDSDTNAGLLIMIQGDSTGATAQIDVYSNATDYSTTSVTIPDQVDLEEVFLPFSAFTVAGGSGVDFSSVGAIELLVNGVANLDGTVTVLSSLKPSVITANLENSVATIEIEKSTNGEDADTATGPLLEVGSTATFTYTVTNTGGADLENVVVVDDNGTSGDPSDDFSPTLISGDTNSNNILETTETWTYEATRTVTAGQYTNIATATADDTFGASTSDTDPSNHFGVTAAIALVKSTNGSDANTATGPVVPVGDTVTFSYSVTNTGNVALDAISVRDDNGTSGDTSDDFDATFVSGDTNGNGRLDLTETWTFEATGTATIGQYENTGTATGNPVDTNGDDIAGIADASATDLSHYFGASTGINLVKSTNGEDANTATGPYLAIGSTATFSYVVTNTGNVPLADVTVTDDNGTAGDSSDDFSATFVGGDTDSDGLLDTDETWTYEATATVVAGQYSNIGTAEANPVDEAGSDISGMDDVTDTDPSNHFGASAGINIVKSTNGDDANTATGPLLEVGATATFTYVVTNTGTAPLGSVVVVDDNGTAGDSSDDFSPTLQGGDTNSNNLLDTTETWTYEATRTVTAGQYSNTGDATANPVDPDGDDIAGMNDVDDSDVSNHFGFTAGIQIIKSTNGEDADSATGPTIAVGDTATFTYVITNTGSVPLASVDITDDNGTSSDTSDDFSPTFQSGDTNSNSLLDTTETWTYEATRTVTAGQYTNIGTATGNPVDFSGADISAASDVSDTNASNHFGFTSGISLEKLTNGIDTGTGSGPSLNVGSTVTFTYNVTNTGNIALTNISVTDDNGTPGDSSDDFTPTRISGDTDGDNELDVSETWVYQATSIVTIGDYSNIATVTGEDPDSELLTATDPSAHTGVEPLSKRRFLASDL
jgi:hypothetical protein